MRNKKNVSAENSYQLELLFADDVSNVSSNLDSNLHFPAAGNRNGEDVNNRGSNGNYWSGSLNTSNSDYAYNLNFNSDNRNPSNNNNRNNGRSVRPVSESINGRTSRLLPYKLTREQLLADLYKAYRMARKGKRNTHSQLQFEFFLEDELVKLRDELWTRTYAPSPCICFVIRDPKLREIFAASFRDRIVHHLYFNYVNPMFDSLFVSDSYSCRKGKGTTYGISRMEHHIKSCSNNWKNDCYILKMDIKGYFMNISRSTLLQQTEAIFNRMAFRSKRSQKTNGVSAKWIELIDYPFICWLNKVIITHDPLVACRFKGNKKEHLNLPPSKTLFCSQQECGLPIGNLTSQLFSNVYMNDFDQWMKRQLKCHHYGRYVDDIFVVHRSKSRLREIRSRVQTYVKQNLMLDIHPNKVTVTRALYGVDFLGGYLKPFRRYLRNETQKRIMRRFKMKYKYMNFANRNQTRSYLNSFLGYVKQYSTFKYRSSLLCKKVNLQDLGCFDNSYSLFRLYKVDVLNCDYKK